MRKGLCIGKIVLLLTFVSVFCILGESMSEAKTASRLYNSGKYHYLVTMTTQEYKTKRYPITESQAKHKKGYITTISVNNSKTTSVSASQAISVGCSYFVDVSASLSLTQTASYTVGTSVSYSIPKSKATGYYRIEVVYPGYKTEKQVARYNYNFSKSKVTYRGNVEYIPQNSGMYKELVHYA